MSAAQLSRVTTFLYRAAGGGEGRPDDLLLHRFVSGRDEAAFEALVRRYGPMVFGVCRRMLPEHDAEDAFQATFIVLARKAAGLLQRERLAGWLHGVAVRVALKARQLHARRRARERELDVEFTVTTHDPDRWSDVRPVLDEEVSRLPERYREALVLCDIQGKTYEEARRLLAIPLGTVASRLKAAREKLRTRLA